jgi:transcriptional regulator with XRE-family HTH domain
MVTAKRKPTPIQDDPELQQERKRIGARLRVARHEAGHTLDSAADALTKAGYAISKGAIGHWETGVNMPDVHWLQRLAKLYQTTIDALIWDDAISVAAIQIAKQYDSLPAPERAGARGVWDAHLRAATARQDPRLTDALHQGKKQNDPATKRFTGN